MIRALLRRELCNKRFVEQDGVVETGGDKGMLTPEDAVLLTVMRRRRIELETLKHAAQTRADELQAQLDELDLDYDRILQAVVLI